MTIGASIDLAMAGLRATQAGMDVVAQNVSNAGSVGYTRRILNVEQQVAGDRTIGVRIPDATRALDAMVQRQLRLERAGAGYTAVKAAAHSALNRLFDAPGAAGSLPTLLNAFTGALGALANNPSSYANRATALSAASSLAGSLNSLSDDVQSMRQAAEGSLAAAVGEADAIVSAIAGLNARVVANPGAPALLDSRDALVDRLSALMDVKVTTEADGWLAVSTSGGLQLVTRDRATRLSFDARSPLGPQSAWDADPAKRGVGTITATDASGVSRDVAASGAIRSGSIAAQLELRDRILPQAQAQLDELAAGLASALSDRAIAGTAASSGAAAGFELDLAPLQAGNAFTLTLREAGGAARTVTFVRADTADGAAAATGGGQVGIDFSGGLSSVAAQVQAALDASYTVSNPSGATLRILDDGAASTTDVLAMSGTATVGGLASGFPELPFFVDGGRAGAAYTGSFEGGRQLTGFAARVAVNAGAKADPAALVAYGPGVAAGDAARPTLMLDRLTAASRSFSGAAGIDNSTAPYTGSVVQFAQRIVETQALDAAAAATLDEGQSVVLNAVESRFADSAGVSIDTELATLIQLQTAYGANARVLTAARDMMDLLLRIGS